MDTIYFTLTGTKYYHGKDFLEPGMKVKLRKEPDNKYDKIGKTAVGEVVYVMPTGVLCRLGKKALKK